jgi:hypothetical protein
MPQTTSTPFAINKQMKTTHLLVHAVEPLVRCQIKMAQRAGLEEIRISIPRAKELLHIATIAKKEISK